MKDSIKAREYFHVKRGAESDTGREMRGIYDGDELICAGYVMTEQDHADNMDGNECYQIIEVFTTRKGNQFIYSTDWEIDEYYIIKITKE